MWRPRDEAKIAVTQKSVQYKMHEEGSAVVYSETAVDKNKLTSK
jgi:hypothetical protein